MCWQNYPLLRLLIPLILGMLVADAWMVWLCDSTSYLFVLLCLSAAALLICNPRRGRVSFFGMAAVTFAFVLGVLCFAMAYSSVREEARLFGEGDVCLVDEEWRGVVTGLPQEKPRTWAVELGVDGCKVLAYVHPGEDSVRLSCLNVGDTLLFRTYRFVPTCPQDVQGEDSAFMGYRRYLFFHGVSVTCYVRPDDWRVAELSDGESNVLRTLFMWRKGMSAVYRDAGFEGEEGALIDALTTGDRSVMSKELQAHYTRAGLTHVLALSGFHLAVIYAMLNMLLFGGLRSYRWQWLKALVIIVCLWVFTLLVGAPPSLVRSAVMCSLMSVASCTGRRALSVNSMTFAATLMLLFDPLVLMDVGFQLSFVSVLGICVVAVPLCERYSCQPTRDELLRTPGFMRFRRLVFNHLLGIVVVSAVCSVFTAPLVAYYFHSVPVLSMLSNLLVSLLSVIILYVAGLWWIFCWWSWLRDVLTSVLSLCAWMMNSVAEWISSFSWAVLAWSPSSLTLICSYLILTFAISIFYLRKAWCVKLFLLSIIAFCASSVLM